MNTRKPFKAVRAFRNNAPDYWAIFAGVSTFGADPVATCDRFEDAKLIVDALNEHFEKEVTL